MSDVNFRVHVHEPDGTKGLIELTPAMEETLYQAGLRVIEDLGHEVGPDYQGGSDFVTIDWDDSLTEVDLGGYKVSPEAAAEVIGLGIVRVMKDALERDN